MVDKFSNKPTQDPVKKDFYMEVDSVKERSQKENDEYLEKNQIATIGHNVPRPV